MGRWFVAAVLLAGLAGCAQPPPEPQPIPEAPGPGLVGCHFLPIAAAQPGGSSSS